jgi:hypothetical protein
LLCPHAPDSINVFIFSHSADVMGRLQFMRMHANIAQTIAFWNHRRYGRMVSIARNNFLSVRDWHQSVVGGQDVILRRTSALEYLHLFVGYVHEKTIDVYAKRRGEYENVNYHIVDSYGGIDYITLGDVKCATPNQVFNDMLSNYDNMKETVDEQSLIEGLAGYYFSHGESFDGLKIRPENMARYGVIKEWAVEYYSH